AYRLDKVSFLTNGALLLRSTQDSVFIFVPVKSAAVLEGKTYEFGPDDKGNRPRPAIHVHVHSIKPPVGVAFSTSYALRLEFGKEHKGDVPGRLYLCLPDKGQSFIAGTFTVKVK